MRNTAERVLAERGPRLESARALYVPELEWEPRMHRVLGVPWPCPDVESFASLWRDLTESLDKTVLSPVCWHDSSSEVARAVYCLAYHLGVERAVETGVARGITTRFILEALSRNGRGRLWSIDLPPLDRRWGAQVGAAVPDRLRGRWSYVRGSSRRLLPGLLRSLGEIDLFVHDSLHSQRNMRFEMESAWQAIRPGGALVVDDIAANGAFHDFAGRWSPAATVFTPAGDDGSEASFGILRKRPA